MSESTASTTAASAPDGLPPRQQRFEQQLTQPPRGAHLLTSTTKSHRQATNGALAADDSTPAPGQEKTTAFMCFPISSMPFSWFRKRDEPKDAPTSSSMETPSSHQPPTSSYPKDSNTMGDDAVNVKLYSQEWRKGANEGTFKGKQSEIEKQFDEFWKDASAKEDVDAYLNHKLNHTYSTRDKGVKPKTPFTDWNKNSPEKVLAEGRDVIIVGNHASFDIAQYPEHQASAGMSMIHLLGLTKKSVYNGVSLNNSNVDVIDQIIDVFKSNWPNKEFQEKVLHHQFDAIDRVWRKALENAKEASTEAAEEEAKAMANWGHELALKHYKELEWEINDLEVTDFEFGLHLYPDHSVPHFHLHIIAMRKGMRKYSTSRHDEKTKDAVEVRDFIRTRYPSNKAGATESN